jgi:Transposase DNA-binding
MNVSSLLSASDWAQQTFGTVCLGDRRRTQRAVGMAAAMAHDPSASLPGQMQSEGQLHAASRFLQNPQVSYERLMRPHV